MRAREFIVEADNQKEPSARQRFLNRVIGPESGGDVSIKNPRSSATGLFQFIKSTWDNTVAKAKPGDAHYGVSFKDMPNNLKAQRAAADQISREYQATIQRNKLPDTPGMYYLLHGHGPKALQIYNSPDKQLKDIYDPYVYNKKGEIVYDQKTGKPKKSLVYQQNPNFNPEEKISTFIANRAASVGDTMANMFPGNSKLASVEPTIKTKTAKKDAETTTPTQVATNTTVEPKVVPKNEPTIIDKAKKVVSNIVGPSLAPNTATANVPTTPDKKGKPMPKVGSPEYDEMMWDRQIAAGDKFSKEREARLEKERLAREKRLPIDPPITDPELDPEGWQKYTDYMHDLQIEKGDKAHDAYMKQEIEAERKRNQTKQNPETAKDDSYYDKFMNLFK